MLLSLFALNTMAREGLMLYTVSYSLATIGIFAVLIRMDDYTIDGFNGLAKSQPMIAFVTTIFLLSLAGIPVTSGFLAKYFMVAGALKSHTQLWLVIFALLCAAVSVYYYFRIIQAMYFKEGEPKFTDGGPAYQWMLVIVSVLILVFGIFPEYVINWLYYDLF